MKKLVVPFLCAVVLSLAILACNRPLSTAPAPLATSTPPVWFTPGVSTPTPFGPEWPASYIEGHVKIQDGMVSITNLGNYPTAGSKKDRSMVDFAVLVDGERTTCNGVLGDNVVICGPFTVISSIEIEIDGKIQFSQVASDGDYEINVPIPGY